MSQNVDNMSLRAILANAPGHPLIWHQFLDELTRQLHCGSGILLVSDLADNQKNRFLFSAHINKDYQEHYETRLNKLDTFNHVLCNNPTHIFYNQTLAEVADKNGFIPPDGQQFRFGVSIPCNSKHALSLLLNRQTAFTPAEQRQTERVLRGFVPALDEAMRAEQRHKISSQLRQTLGGPFDSYIIIDRQLQIVFSDPVFTALIQQMDCVHIDEKRFGMKNPAIEKRLLSLIETRQSGSIHNQCQSCQITLLPTSSLKNLYPWECYKEDFILAFTHDKTHNPTLDRLMTLHHLSHCEAVCALHFMRTPSITDIASNTFRSQETVRNHLKHVMQKMDVHSQAELMKKMITLASL